MASAENNSPRMEWLALLACASPLADPEKITELFRSLNWRVLLQLAEDHGMTGLLEARLRDVDRNPLPAEIQLELQERRRTQLLVSLSMTAELLRLLDRFAAAEVAVLVLKGPVLSVQAYGDPGARQYGDLDILVRNRDIRLATQTLMESAFDAQVSLETIDSGKVPGEYAFTAKKNGLRVELHTELTLRYFPRPLAIDEIFARQTRVRVDAREVPALSLEDELVMICVHGSKDLWAKLLWTADVAAIASRQTDMDWERVNEIARNHGAVRMLHSGLRLAQILLHAPLPVKIAASVQGDLAAEKIVEQIAGWMPSAGDAPPGIFERALFRVRLCASLPAGVLYLTRLSLSPTEDDWSARTREKPARFLDMIRRPFRLARKYGRDGKS
jgi:Uncharacterised nucleotidyltransferase